MVEILVVVGALGVTTGVGVVAVTKAREGSAQVKLESDVGRLNHAVRTYLANGGSISEDAEAGQVLAKLKTRAAVEDAKTIVGVGGPFIDERMGGIQIGNTWGALRATWNKSTQRFELARSGVGFTSFHLKAGAPLREVTLEDGEESISPDVEEALQTESRSTAQKFSQQSGWVWDFDSETSVVASGIPSEIDTDSVSGVSLAPVSQAAPQRLREPEFSLPEGLYRYAQFPMGVTLTNPNPSGSSMLFYSLNNSGWTRYYEGSELSLPTETLTSSLRTYAAAINSEEWNDSSSVENLYKTIFFRGSTAGVFHSPVGEAKLVTNLTNGKSDSTFTWGRPAKGHEKSNEMKFTPAANFTVVPDQEFKLGDLYYYNGTVDSGTTATGVKLRFGLSFSVPTSQEQFEFDFRLFSTVNNGVSEDADADFVWVPTLASQFTAEIQGETFYLQLRFGNSTANGFTTIDEFHVHENKSATGALYGRFTTNPNP